MQGVGRRVVLNPNEVVDDPETEALQREAGAEDYVVRAGDPQRTVWLENAPRLPEPPDVELVILLESHRPVPLTLVNRRYAVTLHAYAAAREPVRRIC